MGAGSQGSAVFRSPFLLTAPHACVSFGYGALTMKTESACEMVSSEAECAVSSGPTEWATRLYLETTCEAALAQHMAVNTGTTCVGVLHGSCCRIWCRRCHCTRLQTRAKQRSGIAVGWGTGKEGPNSASRCSRPSDLL